MRSVRLATLVMLAGTAGAAGTATAQSGSPPAPVATTAPALQLPPSAPPPPRPAAILPAAQRTPTPPLNPKPAPDSGAVPASRRSPDSTRAAAQRALSSASASLAPAARTVNPPRRQAQIVAPAISRTVNAAEAPPIGATMRCKDGSYLTTPPASGSCSANGGIAVTYPVQSTPPAPRPQPQKRP